MKKHAYLIIAHNEFEILEKLMLLLDSENVDIYLHIDKKVKNFNFDYFENLTKKSKVYFTNRINVSWGSDSQIKCELLLLENALKNGYYDYYHLISGVDMPLRNIHKINEFFENVDYDFIRNNNEENDCFLKGIRYKYYFQQRVGRGKKFKEVCFKIVQRGLVSIQKIFGYDRVKKSKLNYVKSDQWFSITNRMAKYIVNNKENIKKYFYNTYLSDEIAIATIAYNSPYKNNIKNDSLRYIDWERGQPYIFTINDYEELIKSDKLFARKFSSLDMEIVDKLYKNARSNI